MGSEALLVRNARWQLCANKLLPANECADILLPPARGLASVARSVLASQSMFSLDARVKLDFRYCRAVSANGPT